MEHEILITRLFNDYLGGVGTAILNAVGAHAHDPARPWTNWITMQIVVAVLMVVGFAWFRSRLSMDKPGPIQHFFELLYNFLKSEAEGYIADHNRGQSYVAFCGSIFLFVLICNLIGLVPGFESPTMFPYVPAGLAVASFLYYNYIGIKSQGIAKYAAHFAGPSPFLAPLMIPIEIISNLARPLSLTVRLYANMYAGEQVTLVFLSLTYLIMPAAFMGLHTFVGFLQAYIFTALTMIYVGGAIAHDEH